MRQEESTQREGEPVAPIDEMENLGREVKARRMGEDEAVLLLMAAAEITEAGARDIIRNWETARACYQGGA